MLAELAAANSAYATISKFIANSKEISDALASLKNLVGAEEELKARGNPKKDGLFSKVMGKSAHDFDEFLALQKYQKSARNWKVSAACTQSPALGINSSILRPRCASSARRKPRQGSAK